MCYKNIYHETNTTILVAKAPHSVTLTEQCYY